MSNYGWGEGEGGEGNLIMAGGSTHLDARDIMEQVQDQTYRPSKIEWARGKARKDSPLHILTRAILWCRTRPTIHQR